MEFVPEESPCGDQAMREVRMSNIRKVLVGCSSPPDKGSGIMAYVRDLCEALRAIGVEVHLVSPSPEMGDWLNVTGVMHYESPRQGSQATAALALIAYCERVGIQGAINNDNPLLQSIAPLLWFPCLAIGHMSKSSIASLATFNNPWLDYVVAISYDMQAIFVTRHGVPVAKCPVVHSGIRLFRERCEAKATSGPLKLVFVGGFNTVYKSADLIADLVSLPDYQRANTTLTWYGDVPPRVQARLPADAKIAFRGRVAREQLLREISAADIFLFPSRYEACPVSLMEAMSCGLAPIVSDGAGAMRWMVNTGEDGYVAPLSHWPRHAAKLIAYLAGNRERLAEMKQMAQARADSDFSIDRVCQRLLHLLASPTVARRNRPSGAVILRWHRPLRPDQLKAPLFDRICIRLGILRKEGTISLGS